MAEQLVLETSALLDLMVRNAEGAAVAGVLRGQVVHVSDHAGVEVAAALCALAGGSWLPSDQLEERIRLLVSAPFTSHPARDLLAAASARTGLRLPDALCVELSWRLAAPLVTTDSRLATVWPNCWLVTVPSAPAPPAAGS